MKTAWSLSILVISCACLAQEAPDVVTERATFIPAWSMTLVETEHCRPESDICSIKLHAEGKNKIRHLIASNLVGPFIPLPKAKRVFSCEDNALMETDGPELIGIDGSMIALPAHPGYLRDCNTVGTGEELLLIYSLLDQTPYSLIRIIDSAGYLIVEKRMNSAGIIEFTVSNRRYQTHIPAPEHPF